MATIRRAQVLWTGFNGAPGYSNFYGAGAASAMNPLHDFFVGLKDMFPSQVHFHIPGGGDTFDDVTGELIGSWETNPGGWDVVSARSGIYSAPIGAVINWRTAGINRGHKVMGRTFLVPLMGDQYQNDGSLADAAAAQIKTAAEQLVADFAGDLLIWSRPRSGAGGHAFPITSVTVPDKCAVLRSRRD